MARVSLLRCQDYSHETLKEVIYESFDRLGGIERYVASGETVFLKANLVMMRKPDQATTTHPAFVYALAQVLSEHGAEVIVGDSPGGPFNEIAMNRIYTGCDYGFMHQPEQNIRLNQNFRESQIANPRGKLLKQLTVMEAIEKADKVISVAKLKTHSMTVFTGGVKNMFGIIPGIHKAEYHYKMPGIQEFSDMLVDVCLAAAPVLTFMDGIVGMEGPGPSSGSPVKIGAVIASDSPYHLDFVASRLVGMDPLEVPTISRTVERDLVDFQGGDVEMVGLHLEEFGIHNVEYPPHAGLVFFDRKLPEVINRALIRLMNPKPVFDASLCVKCGECVRACPAQVITMGDDVAEVALDKCIRCFCCQELCPHKAVTVYRNPLLNRIVRL